ncbi:MAG: hypothetical protein JSR17_09080 [Proteobacteria bacterium]|nr:hypothetical protein [Pseudomonadota bacterium]
MKRGILPLAVALLGLSGCTNLTPDITGNSPTAEYYRARFNIIDNYYAGPYYISEYYIGDTNRSWCSDGYCYKSTKWRNY